MCPRTSALTERSLTLVKTRRRAQALGGGGPAPYGRGRTGPRASQERSARAFWHRVVTVVGCVRKGAKGQLALGGGPRLRLSTEDGEEGGRAPGLVTGCSLGSARRLPTPRDTQRMPAEASWVRQGPPEPSWCPPRRQLTPPPPLPRRPRPRGGFTVSGGVGYEL